MNINIFIALGFFFFACFEFIISYFFLIKKINQEKRCSKKVTGKIIRYSSINYEGIHIPYVEYIVEKKKYHISGPKFQGVTKIYIPFSSNFDDEPEITTNITNKEKIPQFLNIIIKGQINENEMIDSLLLSIFPLDSQIDVYYNPSNPKEAYVQRFEGYSKPLLIILSIIILLFITIGIIFLFIELIII